MIEAPVIETERLRLRAPTASDYEVEAAFFATERSRFVGGPLDREQVWRSFACVLGHWLIRGYGFFAVEEKDGGAYLGRVGHWFPEGWPEPEIGWTISNPAAEGRGVAFEAAVAVRRHAYEALGWSTAISLIDPANARSIKLAERLGAVYEAPFVHVRHGEMRIYRHPAPSELASGAAA